MTNVNKTQKSWQLRFYPLMTLIGWMLVMLAVLLGLFLLAPTAADYFGSNSKAVRDAAEIGSGLQGQLATLTSTPLWLEPALFVGVASFMVGIAMAFSTIPELLKNRGEVMSLCFPILVNKGE
jgi:hypothetical protein